MLSNVRVIVATISMISSVLMIVFILYAFCCSLRFISMRISSRLTTIQLIYLVGVLSDVELQLET